MLFIHFCYIFGFFLIKAEDSLETVLRGIREELNRETRQTGGPTQYQNQYQNQYYQAQNPTQRPPTQPPTVTQKPQSRAKQGGADTKLIDLATDIRNFIKTYQDTHTSDRVSHFIVHDQLILYF